MTAAASITTGCPSTPGRCKTASRLSATFPAPANSACLPTRWRPSPCSGPGVCELASSKALRVTVIGDHTAALELALAVRQRLPSSAVTLVVQTR